MNNSKNRVMYKVKAGQEPPDWNVEEWMDE